MAAKLEPSNVSQKHQSLHHFIADAPKGDQAVLDVCSKKVLGAMKNEVVAWIVDDTGYPKKGARLAASLPCCPGCRRRNLYNRCSR
jgi:SRSO17 transposase